MGANRESIYTMRNLKHEELFITSFLLPGRHKRALHQLACMRKRSQFLNRLGNLDNHYLDERYSTWIPEEMNKYEEIYNLLKANDAPQHSYLISRYKSWDKKYMLLNEALTKILNSGYGTVISLIPGHLALYESECPNHRCLLVR